MPAIISLATTNDYTSTNFKRSYIYLVCLIASLGGILFGFDLVIISGTIPFFSKYFNLQQQGIGWAVGCINLGAAAGALIAGKLSDAWGRKKLLLLCAFLFVLTGMGTGWATNFFLFISFRLLSGVAVGAAALVCPIYIAEISPAPLRGRMVTFYQLAIVIGLLCAYLSDYLLLNSGINNWRWMFSSQSIPALLFFFGLFIVDESPRWLIRKKKMNKALAVLSSVGGDTYGNEQVKIIKESFKQEIKERWQDLFLKKYRGVVITGIGIAVFSQADGQNAIFSYAPVIFSQAGVSGNSAFLQSVFLGLINFIFTFVAIALIDRIGRKNLLLVGSILLCLDAFALAAAFGFHSSAYAVFAFMLAFIGVYAATLGPVTWVALSEIFPNKIRGSAMALATLALWIANFFTTTSFPLMKEYFGLPVTFAIHAGICLIYFIFVFRRVPETKGKSLEEIEEQLVR